jgi:hypothetical protein
MGNGGFLMFGGRGGMGLAMKPHGLSTSGSSSERGPRPAVDTGGFTDLIGAVARALTFGAVKAFGPGEPASEGANLAEPRADSPPLAFVLWRLALPRPPPRGWASGLLDPRALLIFGVFSNDLGIAGDAPEGAWPLGPRAEPGIASFGGAFGLRLSFEHVPPLELIPLLNFPSLTDTALTLQS